MRTIRVGNAGRTLKTVPNQPMPWIKARERAYARRGAKDLADIMRVFGLGATATGRLFDVSRQAVDQWLVGGVPLGRLADIGQVAQAARSLYTYFRPERIPQIVTQPIPGLDGRSVLDVAKTEPRRIVELVEATRSYVPPAA
jgi:hypothetical protein